MLKSSNIDKEWIEFKWRFAVGAVREQAWIVEGVEGLMEKAKL